MTSYTLILTSIETACGVTLEAVAEALPKVLMIDNGNAVVLPFGHGPALATAVSRAALAAPTTFSHLSNGYPVYVVA